ncbi:beta-ketoacyl synthase N-terminal-like domain-containing protein [Kitasatospora mediocidica]|uniref:beta-ketoacyl synthase N-terminal-like domain-containing protein n=1 Tax=Kitasatospora mediocidica TaxID=58352 RepID=UPI000569E9EA|nr:beta-ketoacyl synthase N-terminal-like domain-containing protein [Kitasatospora mediocidica]
MSRLRTLATATWPHPQGPRELPPLPGFSASTFNPLVAAVAELCLTRHRDTNPAGDHPSPPGTTDRTGLLLASAGGDRATALAIESAAAADRRMPPLLFFQSNPNAVLGHIAARWGLTGPVVAISPREAAAPGQIPADALELAALLLADGDADQVLVIAAEQAEQAEQAGDTDHATAVLVTSA